MYHDFSYNTNKYSNFKLSKSQSGTRSVVLDRNLRKKGGTLDRVSICTRQSYLLVKDKEASKVM